MLVSISISKGRFVPVFFASTFCAKLAVIEVFT